MNKRNIRSDAQLRDLVQNSVLYEANMMALAARATATYPKGSFEYNMAVECFLVHFRNMREFLFPPTEAWNSRKRNDDVIAHDYQDSWKHTISDWTECSADEKNRIDKLLAHISYSRRNLDHSWPIAKMTRAIFACLRQFISGLPGDRQEWFAPFASLQ